ncbi:unnamed protein product [Acanthoscelides obtectus]|uniref:Uncharacterized protein n=1 Tax=Acanthoscelides obtectus TaxID=200917 RepID=A0A9P0KPV7_ACAOB|nr:unnamed protein product [Acanthoscelides obtectus]CAK1646534.1 Zinc finger protein 227 [Acanthoscelides obtectus]
MEKVIREGALRLLTNESSCDVILSCQGHRLMAHKLILSVASPVFKYLISEAPLDTAVLIFPDVSASIMSILLDYVYTGTAVVYSHAIQDFLALAELLKIHLDILPDKPLLDTVKKKEEEYPEIYSKRTKRKLPNLVPIEQLQCQEKRRRLKSFVLPSPWCARGEAIFGDPRESKENLENRISTLIPKRQENDSNNNFSMPPYPNYYLPNSLSRNVIEDYRIPRIPIEPAESIEHLPTSNLISNFSRNFSQTDFENVLPRPPMHQTEVRSQGLKDTEASKSLVLNADPIKTEESRLLWNTPIQDRLKLSEDKGRRDKESISSISSNENSRQESTETGNADQKGQRYDKQKPFKCEDCGKCFSQLRNYKYHRSVHEGTKEFAAKCQECGKMFNDRGYLSSHMKIHRDKKEYACPHCPKRFNQRVAYNMHLRIHTGVKPHECNVCGKSFSRKMLLKQHQRVHTGERPYSCPECGKTFTKKHHLKTHMNFHTGLKPYKCDRCGLAFSQSSNMRTHYKKCVLRHGGGDGSNSGGEGASGLKVEVINS